MKYWKFGGEKDVSSVLMSSPGQSKKIFVMVA